MAIQPIIPNIWNVKNLNKTNKKCILSLCSSDSEAIWGKNCSQYTGYEYNIAELTGLNFENDGLADYYTNDYISFRESELKYKNIVEYGDHLSVYDLQVESGYH